MKKRFRYKISDNGQIEKIRVDLNTAKTINDLIKNISLIYPKFSQSHLVLANPPKEGDLTKIEEDYVFYFIEATQSPNFHLNQETSNKTEDEVQINEHINEYFRSKRLYYSDLCMKNNLHAIASRDENGQMQYTPKLSGKYVISEYGGNRFYFSENEAVEDACKLIKTVYVKSRYINILFQNKSLAPNDKLECVKEYTLKIQYIIWVNSLDDKYITNFPLNFLSTVRDLQNEMYKTCNELKSKDIILYDQCMERIDDLDMRLRDIQRLDKFFYFSVSERHHSGRSKRKSKSSTHQNTPNFISDKLSDSSDSKKISEKGNNKSITNDDENILSSESQHQQSPKLQIEENTPEPGPSINIKSQEKKQNEPSSADKNNEFTEEKQTPLIYENKSKLGALTINKSHEEKQEESSISPVINSNDKTDFLTIQKPENNEFTEVSKNEKDLLPNTKKTKKTRKSDFVPKILKEKNESKKVEELPEENKLSKEELISKEKIQIIFICDHNNKDKAQKKLKTFPIHTKIEEVKQIISDEWEIKDRFDIKCNANDQNPIDLQIELKDIQNKMHQEEKKQKIRYTLYITFIPMQEKEKNQSKSPKAHNTQSFDFNKPIRDSNNTQSFDFNKPIRDSNNNQLNDFNQPIKNDNNTQSFDFNKPIRNSNNNQLDIFNQENEENWNSKAKRKNDSVIKKKISDFTPKTSPLKSSIRKQIPSSKEQEVQQPKPQFGQRPKKLKESLLEKQKQIQKASERMVVYNFQTNRDDKSQTIELDPQATVREFKEKVAQLKNVPNPSNIKALFAGKDLLDDIILDDLGIGDSTIFVYIRSEEEILLLTAKALQIESDYYYDYEEEEEEHNE